MAVNIDTVYQRVLAIANKEQRGYITPQEYNLFANQAQMSIFEQYFYDISQFDRLPGSEHPYSDMTTLLEEKISIFKKRNQPVTITNQYGDGVLPTDMYRLGTVLRFSLPNVTGSTAAEIEEVSDEEYMYYSASPLAAPSKYRPIYIRNSATTIKLYPNATTINTGLDKAATQYFQQTGKNQYNGQNNQFNAEGFSLAPSSTQGGSGSVNVYMQEAPTDQIKVGQVVTGTNIVTSPATTVKSFTAGATTSLSIGGITSGSKTFTVVAPTSGNGTIAIGQLLPTSGFPPETTVVGVKTAQFTVAGGAYNTSGNDPTITMAATSAVKVGMVVTSSDAGIPSGATVASINSGSVTTFELSVSTTGTAVTGATLTFTVVNGLNVTASVAANNDVGAGVGIEFLGHLTLSQPPSAALTSSNALTFNEADSLSYIEPGQTVTGSGVPANTTVSAINGSAITLSNNLTTGGFVTLTFASDDIKCHYIRRPVDVVWGYNTVNSTALYNSSISTNFELHESEETQLVIKILALAGISMKDQSMYQIATAEENRTIQQEKL